MLGDTLSSYVTTQTLSRSEPQDDADFVMNEKSSMTCV